VLASIAEPRSYMLTRPSAHAQAATGNRLASGSASPDTICQQLQLRALIHDGTMRRTQARKTV
jgi:hypothetical protein